MGSLWLPAAVSRGGFWGSSGVGSSSGVGVGVGEGAGGGAERAKRLSCKGDVGSMISFNMLAWRAVLM